LQICHCVTTNTTVISVITYLSSVQWRFAIATQLDHQFFGDNLFQKLGISW
jgi:hypothetical protein